MHAFRPGLTLVRDETLIACALRSSLSVAPVAFMWTANTLLRSMVRSAAVCSPNQTADSNQRFRCAVWQQWAADGSLPVETTAESPCLRHSSCRRHSLGRETQTPWTKAPLPGPAGKRCHGTQLLYAAFTACGCPTSGEHGHWLVRDYASFITLLHQHAPLLIVTSWSSHSHGHIIALVH